MAASDGYIMVVDEAGFQEMDTKSCVHCGGHFVVIPGSGKLRQFCQPCGGVVCCDKPQCLTHDPNRHPFTKWLDLVESGKPPLHVLS